MRVLVVLIFSAGAMAQTSAPSREILDGAMLEAAQRADPDDAFITGRLLTYYGVDDHDPDWSKRYRLIAWNIQHHPEASFLGFPSAYQSIPHALHERLKEAWIARVRDDPGNPQVLRNAANGLLGPRPTYVRSSGPGPILKLVHKVDPVYPPLARQDGVHGTVLFVAVIGVDGRVQSLKLISGHPLLIAAATDAAKQRIYEPALTNGYATETAISIQINFALQP